LVNNKEFSSHLLGGQNYLAPLESPVKRILDVGTGTGIWAVEMAEKFPEAQVIATDITPIQPNWVYSNCHFEIDDAEKDWTWPNDCFDFIHSRNLAQGIRDWPRYLQQMYRCCEPGGYIELMELHMGIHSDDNSIPPDSAIMRVSKLWGPAGERANLKVLNGEEYAEHARNAGFTDIKVTALKQPWNKWPKNKALKYIGSCMQLVLPSGIYAYHMALFTRILEMPAHEATELLNQAVLDSANRKMHIYNYVYNIVGRKPL
jgi:ubiquinone/menaquinone biosynthesis C-methylase UbiE